VAEVYNRNENYILKNSKRLNRLNITHKIDNYNNNREGKKIKKKNSEAATEQVKI